MYYVAYHRVSFKALFYFSIFIIDLTLFIEDSIQAMDLYAYDTTLYDIVLDKDTLANNL